MKRYTIRLPVNGLGEIALQLPAKIELSDLWRWDGTIGRTRYVILGSCLAVVKYFFDCFVSQTFFHKTWTILEYFAPGYATGANPSGHSLQFYLTMLALSLPFAWTGTVLTLRRLRAAQLSTWLIVFFYVPLLNLVFFKILSWTPSVEFDQGGGELVEFEKIELIDDRAVKKRDLAESNTSEVKERLQDQRDYSVLLDFLSAAILPVIPTVVLIYFSVMVLGSYGYGLFVAVPFVVSIAAPLLYSAKHERSMFQCISVALGSMSVIYIFLLAFAFEGIVCLMMAAPIALVIAAGGGFLAYFVQKRRHGRNQLPKIMASFLVFVPLIIFLEVSAKPQSPLYELTTTVEVDSPPEVVWKHVVAFTRLKPPEELIFKAGVAYPIEAKIHGSGCGAVRHCIFSTGTFVEPITVWDEARLLKFSVLQQALPMKEFSPYKDIHPPHMDGYLMSRQGQFLLIPTANGGTKLSGTTWYQNNMGPAPYWKIWSDQIIHAIHLRVLDHVRELSENEKTVIGVYRKL